MEHLHKHISSHYLNRRFAISDKYDIFALKSHGYFKYPAIRYEERTAWRIICSTVKRENDLATDEWPEYCMIRAIEQQEETKKRSNLEEEHRKWAN